MIDERKINLFVSRDSERQERERERDNAKPPERLGNFLTWPPNRKQRPLAARGQLDFNYKTKRVAREKLSPLPSPAADKWLILLCAGQKEEAAEGRAGGGGVRDSSSRPTGSGCCSGVFCCADQLLADKIAPTERKRRRRSRRSQLGGE